MRGLEKAEIRVGRTGDGYDPLPITKTWQAENPYRSTTDCQNPYQGSVTGYYKVPEGNSAALMIGFWRADVPADPSNEGLIFLLSPQN